MIHQVLEDQETWKVEHLGVWWEWLKDSDAGKVYLKAMMPKMVQEIKEAYVNVMGHLAKQAKTPGFPGKCLKKATEDNAEVKTTEYCSIMGKLMYYMMKVRLELGNAVRELAGQMVKPNSEHWQAVEHVVRYVTHEPHQGVIFHKPRNLCPYIYTDSDYATDENDQRSISGRMITLGGMLIGWSSKKQNTVSLSSCEAEYISYGEACQEAMFMNQLLDELFKGETCAVVYGDNQGALFLVKNQQMSQQMKHIDIHQHFVHDLQQQKKVVGEFM